MKTSDIFDIKNDTRSHVSDLLPSVTTIAKEGGEEDNEESDENLNEFKDLNKGSNDEKKKSRLTSNDENLGSISKAEQNPGTKDPKHRTMTNNDIKGLENKPTSSE